MVQRQIRLSFAAVAQVALAGCVIFLLTATHLPPSSPLLPDEVHNLDKVFHFTAYAILAGLIATVWQLKSGVLTARHLRWAWIAVAIFGALDEITQVAVDRDCNLGDWTTDVTGAAIGLLAFVWLRRRFATPTTEAQ